MSRTPTFDDSVFLCHSIDAETAKRINYPSARTIIDALVTQFPKGLQAH